MKRLTADVAQFFNKQNFVIVSTTDRKGSLHSACKGIVKIYKKGEIHLLDLYKGRTFENLRYNPNISVTAADEHKFEGYTLKGKAKIIEIEEIKSHVLKAWEKKMANRITQRIVKNIRGEIGHPRHPEALFPKPKYLIAMKIDEIIDLTPHLLKESEMEET